MTQQLEGLIDIPSLRRYLEEQLPDKEGELSVEKHVAGFSNETFYVTLGENRWVMRRPPRGDILPTAHDVIREYRVLSALHPRGVRVPRPVLACEDPSVIGAPFYLMQRVEGVVIRDALPEALDRPDERRRISEEMVDALAELHAVDWETTDLVNMAKPQGFLERQLRRWKGQIDLTQPHTRDLPGMAEVTAWLHANLPEQTATSVVHGDYKLDNVMFAAAAPAHLVAIFDWEMATLGDPLADLAWLVNAWGRGDEPDGQTGTGRTALTAKEGFLAAAEMVARYEQRTGRRMANFAFYECLGVWKLAIILEGLYKHYIEGTASNPGAAEFEWRVPELVARAQRIISRS